MTKWSNRVRNSSRTGKSSLANWDSRPSHGPSSAITRILPHVEAVHASLETTPVRRGAEALVGLKGRGSRRSVGVVG